MFKTLAHSQVLLGNAYKSKLYIGIHSKAGALELGKKVLIIIKKITPQRMNFHFYNNY
jgi:hypothetical protein